MPKRKHPYPVCSLEERAALLEFQGGACAICDRDDVALFTDHSYRTGRTRGLLCRQCNTGLGMFKDSPTRLKRALTYLSKPPAKELQ